MSRIPVYVVSVPEYRFRSPPRAPRKTTTYAMTRWFDIRIPKFYVDNKPDFARIGERIDICLKRHFLGRNVAVRVLGSQEHSGKSVDDLITIIKRLGHDRYDPDRTGDRYENIDGKRIDFFALDFKVTAPGRYFERFIEPFYFWPIASREVPVRVDIAIIYDRNKLTRVLHRYKGRENEPKRDGFVFKNADDASSAIIGIIKIDR